MQRVVPVAELDATVDELAAELAAKSPLIMQWGRDSFYRVLEMDADAALVVSPGDAHGHDADRGRGRGRRRVRGEARAGVEGPMTEFEMPETQYAQSGDLSIAYQVLGDGPIDVVFVSGFVSHQELAWELPLTMPIQQRRVVRASDHVRQARHRAVGAHARVRRAPRTAWTTSARSWTRPGSERAAIVGLSEGGPLAILFAATYPERATALVLWDTYARGHRSDDYPIGLDPLLTKQFIETDRGRCGARARAMQAVLRRRDRRRGDAARAWRATSATRRRPGWRRRC